MDAREYNRRAEGRHWTRGDLPWWLRELDPADQEFADAVTKYQRAHGLLSDGKLGPDTSAAIVATEHLRDDPASDPWGPTHLADVSVVPSKREEKKRRSPPIGVGIHTTGAGVPAAAAKHGIEDKQVIRNLLSNPGSYTPNAYVFSDGHIFLCVPTDECAVHGGLGPYRDLYRKGFDHWKPYEGTTHSDIRRTARPGKYDGWKAVADQEGFASPLDLVTDPNAQLWAFDMVPQLVGGKETFTPRQFERVAELILWASKAFRFEIAFRTVLEHGDWNPCARYPWDVGGNFSRRAVGESLRRLSRTPSMGLGADDCSTRARRGLVPGPV